MLYLLTVSLGAGKTKIVLSQIYQGPVNFSKKYIVLNSIYVPLQFHCEKRTAHFDRFQEEAKS